MPRPKNAKTATPAAKTNRAFPARKGGQTGGLTRERIAADLDAFRRAGGKIEVLGVTQALKKITPDEAAPPPAPAKATSAKGK